jgi:hypothetical protein
MNQQFLCRGGAPTSIPKGQTALELMVHAAGVVRTFVYNLAVLQSVITQPLKALAGFGQHIFSQLRGGLSWILKYVCHQSVLSEFDFHMLYSVMTPIYNCFIGFIERND